MYYASYRDRFTNIHYIDNSDGYLNNGKKFFLPCVYDWVELLKNECWYGNIFNDKNKFICSVNSDKEVTKKELVRGNNYE